MSELGQYKLYTKIAFWAGRNGNNELSRECERKASELHKFREVNREEKSEPIAELGKMIHAGCHIWTSSAMLEELGMEPSTILKFIENPEIAEALGEADLEDLKLYSHPKTEMRVIRVKNALIGFLLRAHRRWFRFLEHHVWGD